jgi:MYXO-CTERM domain-containing protein
VKTLLAGLLVACAALVPTLAAAQTKIVIDPGHGGSDPGGVGSGLQEKNIVLDVSTRFRNLLNADSSDVFVSLSARAAYSNNNGAARFMSIHSNAFSTASANGTETFSYSEGGTGAALRNLVQAEMIAAWGLTNRGNKTANFAVLRDTAAPAVLHELGFITNAGDAAKLGSATERQKAAVAHLRAIQRHYGIAPYLPSLSATAPADEAAEAVDPQRGEGDVDGELAGVDADSEAEGESAAGCSVGAGASGASSALLLLGLATVLRRRRRA